MKGDYTKTKHMMDQIFREVHIQVEKTQKSSNNKRNPTNDINLNNVKKCEKKLAKIHGHKSNKKYKKLLRSYDPMLNDNELVKALSDPDDKIRRNYNLPIDLGTKMSDKANNHDINDKSEAASASTSTPSNVIKDSIKQAVNSSEGISLKLPNITKSGKYNNISTIEILPDDNNHNKQPAISADSIEISRSESIQASSSKVEYVSMCPSPKVTIHQYQCKNSREFLKLEQIVFTHDPSRSETFEKLVYILKTSFKFELPRVTKNIYNWHSPKMHVVQQLLQEILQTINQTKNKIIHFMTFLNLLFRKSVNMYHLSIDELYYSFFSFVDFIKRCLLSCVIPILMEWLPMAWNNCFYYGLILVEFILYNDYKRIHDYERIYTLLEWSYVPDIQKLLKILSYDNNGRSESIIYTSENIDNCMKQQNRIKSEHQDIQDGSPKKKIKLTSDQQIFQQAQQLDELTVEIKNSIREAQVILSSIASAIKIEHDYNSTIGTKMSDKANNHDINDKSEASSASTSTPPNVIKDSIKQAVNSSEGISLKLPNITKSGKDNNISTIEILPDDNNHNKQPAISADSIEISRSESIQASSSKVEYVSMCPSPKVTIHQYQCKNSREFLKLEQIVFTHDPSRSETFEKLVYILKTSFKFELPRVTKNIYNWHSPKMHVVQQLLQEILQTINQTKNKIIHFMTFLNILFRKSVNMYHLSIDELYYSFFSFADFIKRCLLSCVIPILMEWLPMAWNNCFYYGLILVEFILYNDYKRIHDYEKIYTLLEWSYVPDIQKLLKILSYDNNGRSESIIYTSENIDSCMKQQNRIKSEHQDIQDGSPKKKIKLTSDQQIFQQAQQLDELTVEIKNSIREAQVILSSIASAIKIEHDYNSTIVI